MEFWKLNLRIGILEIKFERNQSFENYLEIESFKKLNFKKLELWKLHLRIGKLEIKFEINWNFGKLFRE